MGYTERETGAYIPDQDEICESCGSGANEYICDMCDKKICTACVVPCSCGKDICPECATRNDYGSFCKDSDCYGKYLEKYMQSVLDKFNNKIGDLEIERNFEVKEIFEEIARLKNDNT